MAQIWPKFSHFTLISYVIYSDFNPHLVLNPNFNPIVTFWDPQWHKVPFLVPENKIFAKKIHKTINYVTSIVAFEL